MTIVIDKTYRKEKLLDWERKSLTDKFSIFSFSKKSTWVALGLIILGLCVFGFIVPFIPPRYSWGNWTPATTTDEYQFRLTKFLVTVPIMIISVFGYINLRNKIDLMLNIKWTANFRITKIINLGTMKILIINGWRLFIIRTTDPYFQSVLKGQIITIKRTGTFRLIHYLDRND